MLSHDKSANTAIRVRQRPLLAALLACLSLIFLPEQAAKAADATYTFNLPEQSLADTLRAIGHEASVNIIFAPESVEHVTAPAIQGSYTAEQAIARALSGTQLRIQKTNSSSILVEPPGEPSRSERQGRQIPGSELTADGSPVAGLQEVIVTAQKRAERLQDVPVPVAAISAAKLRDSNQLRLQDFYSSVPGLLVSPGTQSTQQLSIRGIAPGNGNPTVGITVDDVPYGSSISEEGVPDIDPGDLDHIEVLRGPQGTLYGANTLGGLIKFVTVDPSPDAVSGAVQAGTVDVQNGSGPGYTFRGLVNVPVSDDSAIRASGFVRRDPGYIDNPVLHIDGINKADVYGGRLSGLWKPTATLSLKLSALYQNYEGDGANDVNINPPYPPPLGDLQQNYVQRVGPFSRKVQAYSAILQWKLAGIDLTSISGYNINGFHDTFDLTSFFGPLTQSLFGVTGTPLFESTGTKKASQELRLASSVGSRVDWLLGGFFTHERTNFDQVIGAEDPVSGPLVGIVAVSRIKESFREYSGFGNLTVHVTDQLDVQAGGRFSHNKQTQDSIGTGFLPPEVHEASRDNSFTYLLVPQLKVSSDLMVYARIASGYRPGGPNNPAPGVPPTFQPDRTRNYEVGAKGNLLDGALSFDTSLYYIGWNNIQISESVGVFGYVGNGGRAKSQGVELSLDSHPLRGLTLSGWIALSDPVLTRGLPPEAVAAGTYAVAGDRLPLSNRFSGNLSIRQSFPLGVLATGFVGGSLTYVGNREGAFQAQGTPRSVLPGYAKIDLQTGLNYDSWTVNLYANNIANKRGLLNGGDNFPGFAYVYIQPRTIGVSLRRTF